MKLFHQSSSWVAMVVRMRLNFSARKRRTRWMSVLALVVLGVAVVGPSPAATISPRRLIEVTDLGNPVISPDGQYVAFRAERASIERNTYDTTWHVQALNGKSPPLSVGDGGAPLRQYVNGVVLPSPAIWSPDGKWIYYRALLNGRVSVWRAATDGSGAHAVTSDAANVRDFTLSSDGKTLKYSVGATRKAVKDAEMAEYYHGIRIDSTVNIAAGLFQSSKVDGRPTTQRFLGHWFSAGPLLATVPDQWKAVDLATMTTRDLRTSELPVRPLTPGDLSANLPVTPTKIAQNPSDGRIAVLIPRHKDKGLATSRYDELGVLSNRRTSHPVMCMAKLCRHRDITGIQWRPGSNEVLFTVTNYDRTQSIYGWNVVTGTVRPIVISNGLVSGSSQRYWDIPCALSSDTLVCIAAEADRPPRLEAIGVSSGQRQVLFAPNKGLEADIAATVPAKLIRWKDKQGREFTGWLFKARGVGAGGHPPPLFVNFYKCYGFLRGGVGNEWPFATLAEDGISALCINAIPEYRLDAVARYDQGRAAVESVVKFLSAEGRIDRTRVGMSGLSYGSEATLWTLTHSDMVTAASVSGVSVTPTIYLFNSLRKAFRSQFRQEWQLGSLEETPKRWREVSPAYQLDKIKAPILFQLPEQEYRLTLEYSLPLMRRHQADMYVFPYETHIKFQPKHKLAVYERNVDWFRFWLQGYEDPSSEKHEQYVHWRTMREHICARSAKKVDAIPWYCRLVKQSSKRDQASEE